MNDLFETEIWKPDGFDPMQLTRDEQLIFAILVFHVGRRRAISIKTELVKTSNLNERIVRSVLKTLTEDRGLAIATTTKEPYGAYLVETSDELEEYCGSLDHRGLSVLRRSALLRKQHFPDYLGQLRLRLEDTDSGR